MRLPVESVEKGDCNGCDEREEEEERAVEAKPCQNRQPVAGALVAGLERHGNASATRGGSVGAVGAVGLGAVGGERGLFSAEDEGTTGRRGDRGRANGAEEALRADKAWWDSGE